MLIYVCSPCRGNPPYSDEKRQNNLKKAAEYSLRVVHKGHTPITPHLLFTQFLDDTIETERNAAINMGLELLDLCSEVWVFGQEITEGMQNEIKHADLNGKPVRYE